MRTAPPVSVRCSGGVVWHLLRAGLPALAAGALAAWALGHAGWPTLPALAVVAVVGAVAWPAMRAAPVHLAWDGQRWTADAVPGALAVMIDAGALLLLRLRPDGPAPAARWIAVGAAEAGPAMHALRAAAFARAAGADAAAAASAAAAADTGPDGLRLPR